VRSELPELRLRRSYVTRAKLRELTSVSSSNFLVHVANKVVFSTDVVVVGIVLGPGSAAIFAIAAKLFQLAFGLASAATSLLYPAFAEFEGAEQAERQRRLLVVGLRGGAAAALLLALPLLFMPTEVITAWVGDGYHDSALPLAILAGVVLIHQPIWLATQYLVARGHQRPIARLLVGAAGVNVVLSVLLAKLVGAWGVALSTLSVDTVVLAVALPVLVAPAAGVDVSTLTRALLKPALPALVVAALVLTVVPRAADADTLLRLAPVGVLWGLLASAAIWRFGLTSADRRSFTRGVAPGAATTLDSSG
jgi:O-antigen/teichoic acid export membrane protein